MSEKAVQTSELASKLKGVLKTVGIALDIRSFNARLRIQKIVYLLRLNTEFRSYLPYSFNLYLHGPYSPALAAVYYNCPSNITPQIINVSSKSVEYGRKVAVLDTQELELMSTLSEVIKVNKGKIESNEAVSLVLEIKPQFRENEIAKAFENLETLKVNYNLDL